MCNYIKIVVKLKQKCKIMNEGETVELKVYQVKIKLYMLKDIPYEDVQSAICRFIDMGFAKNTELLEFHNVNEFKNYCFDSLYPIEMDRVYKKDHIYTITIRTIDKSLAKFFYEALANHYNKDFKGLTSEIKVIPKKRIEKLYCITPAILKTEGGYWKNTMALDDFERRLKENLIKKYNTFMDEKIDEDFQLYKSIEFKNLKPIVAKYKNIKILGDKLNIYIDDDEISQKLAYMCLGTGVLEMNSRGLGFVNFKWL